MTNERYLKFLATQECVKMILSDPNIDELKKGIVKFNGKTYDLVKIGNEMDELVSEILSKYEINVEADAEKSE